MDAFTVLTGWRLALFAALVAVGIVGIVMEQRRQGKTRWYVITVSLFPIIFAIVMGLGIIQFQLLWGATS